MTAGNAGMFPCGIDDLEVQRQSNYWTDAQEHPSSNVAHVESVEDFNQRHLLPASADVHTASAWDPVPDSPSGQLLTAGVTQPERRHTIAAQMGCAVKTGVISDSEEEAEAAAEVAEAEAETAAEADAANAKAAGVKAAGAAAAAAAAAATATQTAAATTDVNAVSDGERITVTTAPTDAASAASAKAAAVLRAVMTTAAMAARHSLDAEEVHAGSVGNRMLACREVLASRDVLLQVVQKRKAAEMGAKVQSLEVDHRSRNMQAVRLLSVVNVNGSSEDEASTAHV